MKFNLGDIVQVRRYGRGVIKYAPTTSDQYTVALLEVPWAGAIASFHERELIIISRTCSISPISPIFKDTK